MDRALSAQICDDTFVTAATRVPRSQGEASVTVANAGHVLPLIRVARTATCCTFGNPSGPLLAMLTGVDVHRRGASSFERGDILVLMTDGILDALHAEDDPLGLRIARGCSSARCRSTSSTSTAASLQAVEDPQRHASRTTSRCSRSKCSPNSCAGATRSGSICARVVVRVQRAASRRADRISGRRSACVRARGISRAAAR